MSKETVPPISCPFYESCITIKTLRESADAIQTTTEREKILTDAIGTLRYNTCIESYRKCPAYKIMSEK